mmetsp:Transcript_10676/g.24867  ORF Transcript_10676/g.24867 Transcript_10676/m.24867 type:complete len:279 (-) Transcript_10676:30-866(-)
MPLAALLLSPFPLLLITPPHPLQLLLRHLPRMVGVAAQQQQLLVVALLGRVRALERGQLVVETNALLFEPLHDLFVRFTDGLRLVVFDHGLIQPVLQHADATRQGRILLVWSPRLELQLLDLILQALQLLLILGRGHLGLIKLLAHFDHAIPESIRVALRRPLHPILRPLKLRDLDAQLLVVVAQPLDLLLVGILVRLDNLNIGTTIALEQAHALAKVIDLLVYRCFLHRAGSLARGGSRKALFLSLSRCVCVCVAFPLPEAAVELSSPTAAARAQLP